MKYFAFILSVYVLGLTVIPCVDVPKDDNLHKIELSNTSSDHHETNHDLCSPFCICVCCVAPIIILTANSNTICSFEIKKMVSKYTNDIGSFLISKVWQPPQS